MQAEHSYPPEPWPLRGQAHVSLWRVPAGRLPAAVQRAVPRGATPFRFGGSFLLATAWVSYQRGSVLEYEELMCTVLVRRGGRLFPTISHIWVDSAASRDGGRALWAIPKELASFEVLPGARLRAREAGPGEAVLAEAGIDVLATLPLRVPFALGVLQSRSSTPQLSRVRGTARPALSRARWSVEHAGPLGFLSGLRPLGTVSMRDFRMWFGALDTPNTSERFAGP
ncbi:Acetoacetate decarboxylase (ADC) [Haloechinothrix alba]|uniref:Acetoacetate decarboxylase (ADC) n=1 Tax=Haloechinothrix alba TaxID=664784 RepID=A0A238Z481_9PSEU|nr:Acetoacetate decarboxylase (ADC) [Haloechinothrix alba]